jgi:hypothetical protein
MRDIHERAALEIAESLMLMLIESGLLSADRVMTALETLVKLHDDLAASDGCSHSEQCERAEISTVISTLMRGTNLAAASRPENSGR